MLLRYREHKKISEEVFDEFLPFQEEYGELQESAKNLHMMHIEDQVLYGGVEGTRSAINALRELRNMLGGSSTKVYNVSTKFDGAPAITCGIVPKGYPNEGKFFVAKKSLFNKNPKYYTTKAEITADVSGDLAEKFIACLEHLPKIFKSTTDIFQGDLMFTASDVKQESIDGQKYLMFHPNTIAYAVPADSEEGAKIKAAKVGIVFHTRYKGDTFDSMTASFDVDPDSDFKTSKAVWTQNINVQFKTMMTAEETKEVTLALSDAGKIFQKISSSTIKEIQGNQEFAKLIEQFNNTHVREGQIITDTKKHVDNLIEWIYNKFKVEIDARKTMKGKQTQQDKLDSLLAFFSPHNKTNLVMMFDLQAALVKAKNLIISKLNKLNKTKTFLKLKNGYKITNQEGFVVINQLSNGAFKLVDRLEFSYANFSPHVIKGWERT